MSLDFNEIDQILKQHFEKITPEEFKSNLKAACPNLFESPKEIVYQKKETIHSTEDFLSDNKNVEYEEVDRILTEHFKKVTPQEFKRNLKIACPSLVDISQAVITNQRHVNVVSQEEHPQKSKSPYIFGLLGAVTLLLSAIFVVLKPDPDLRTAVIASSKPIELGDSLVYEYLQVSDKSGKKASISVVLLSSKYRWQIKQDKILQDSEKKYRN
jgi:hypothetical protein